MDKFEREAKALEEKLQREEEEEIARERFVLLVQSGAAYSISWNSHSSSRPRRLTFCSRHR